jgi:hypothetical protein
MLEDLSTAFAAYLVTLRDASLLARLDSTSLVFFNEDDVRSAVSSDDDLNTAYAIHLTV